MDSITSPTNPLISASTPVFGDNVQDLLSAGTLQLNPTGIIVVNSTADTLDDPNSGVTTLRDAINQANADSGEDLIVFDRSIFSTAQTITLSGTELDITHNLDIIAPRDSLTGGDLVTVSGNKASRVFEIGTGASVNIDGLIVADGKIIGDKGGGILNSGILTLDNSIVSGNNGGGIYNSAGTVSVNNSTISGNNSTFGGGIENALAFGDDGIIIGDDGIENGAGTVSVNNSTISGNTSTFGGGIENGAGIVSVNNSTISGNKASENGGGIYNTYTGTVTLLFSTLTQNTAANGGGVYQEDVPLISNFVRGSFNVRNTIIAANLNSKNGVNPGVNPDVEGTFTSNGYNLIGDNTGSTGFGVTGDIVGTTDNPIDPLLAPLAFNGGSTQTVALLPGSPAILSADPTILDTDPTTDQRGLPRRAADGSADIGAYELS